MHEKKAEVKKELKKNVRAISILTISLIIIYCDISIAEHLNFGENQRIKWTLDFGIYNSLLSIVFSIIYYVFVSNRLYIKMDLINKKEENNEITILGNQPGEIILVLTIKGSYQLLAEPLEVIFPHWIDIQCKSKPYLEVVDNDNDNKCLIHIDKLIKMGNNDLVEQISIDLLSNSEEKNKDLVEARINVPWQTKLFKMSFKNNGIKVKRK